MNLSRLRFHPESKLLIYEPKAGYDVEDTELLGPMEFLARVFIHIPEPDVIRRILNHLDGKTTQPRAPPAPSKPNQN